MKRFALQVFHFFIYSNLFIAACAVLMVNQTCRFLLHESPDKYFFLFVFFSTICSYSFHWYLTSHSVMPSHRILWLKQNRKTHLVLFFIGLLGCGFFFFYLLSYWYWLLPAAIFTFLYSAPKISNKYFRALLKLALGKTIFLALVWMYVTSFLPILISGQPWKNDFTLFIISRYFLIYTICILFDYRDREDDKAAGIRSLITFLNKRSVFYLFVFSLCIFAVATIWMLQFGYGLLNIGILLLPAVITASLYNYAVRNFSDMLYYFVLDGLIALSAIIMLITGI